MPHIRSGYKNKSCKVVLLFLVNKNFPAFFGKCDGLGKVFFIYNGSRLADRKCWLCSSGEGLYRLKSEIINQICMEFGLENIQAPMKTNIPMCMISAEWKILCLFSLVVFK